MKREMKDAYSMEELREIIHELRGEGGCPWDRTLTYESLKPFIGCLQNFIEFCPESF